ncbi:haloacid dehalogenase-like hydrolase domain-containing protein 2 [Elysia marginata]|uniref:Haloacid dehalogenase-like hydrolase domain-containing protein 2 n=1 Tax=Elysia marginata TaxID=1093978 RepID=A0AAV4IRT9_9GAST|nr:haloacid dehalogenase-like hydrolase domain-containing protein 2 [Elysia marginata]
MGKVKAVLIDLSGTLHIDDDPTPGAVEALARLQALPGLNLKYVTNTTKESKRVLMERLNKVGFTKITEDQVFTSLSAARKLVEDRQLRPFFLVDKKAMEDFHGISQKNPNAVVIGLAPDEFNYENMNKAMRLLHNGAELIAIHKARYFQRKDGPALGPGPFVSALEYATDVSATVVGKPTENFFLSSISGFGCSPQECVMIGDDARDDIGGAQSAGMQGILVRTGKYREHDEKKISPPPFRVVDTFADAVKVVEELL